MVRIQDVCGLIKLRLLLDPTNDEVVELVFAQRAESALFIAFNACYFSVFFRSYILLWNVLRAPV